MQRKIATTLAVVISLCALPFMLSPVSAADGTATPGGASMTPIERAKATEKGKLQNPLPITPEIVAEGKALYQAKTCGACHGGDGKGIHCPSVINDAWIYGSDDDTLFRLVALGSEGLAAAGYVRGDKEKHAGPMPGFGEAIGNEQDLWKIIAYLRSLPKSDRGK